ncbi:thiopeptide-type bacteriocin biosynthesis protein [Mucilaginibacter sp. PAMB04274]|uniref:lantibiotic dehydratase n=1 Tax=Mucilaginibacter sp. PAMB04274 TaxID=3138568 RepID=UPI0031F646DF
MKIQLFQKAICRTPAFSPTDILADKWEELKRLIYDASPDFHTLIKDIPFHEIPLLAERAQLTIWKYFNRAKYRATPFGGFASVSIAEIADQQQTLIVQRNPISNYLTDWSEVDKAKDMFGTALSDTMELMTNSTLYRIGNELRYIRAQEGAVTLASVMTNKWISAVVDCCQEKITVNQLKTSMQQKLGCSKTAVQNLLLQLLDAEIIFSERTPNITGIDYFKRSGFGGNGAKMYRIDHRSVKAGKLDANQFRDLPAFFNFWRNVNKPFRSAAMTDFVIAFKNKFGDSMIPLALALDPEMGIGFAGLHETTWPLFKIKARANSGWTADAELNGVDSCDAAFRSFLINGMVEQNGIQLENFKQADLRHNDPFPNTFSAVMSYLDGLPLLETAGGATGNALLGRFTMIDPSFEAFGRELASIEQAANPDILFFDVAFSGEKAVDNVNRRLNVYNAELPLLAWSLSDEVLDLSDISVCIRNSEVILWSMKYHKRMMPRVSTAYNFGRSGFALFRFLCELQHEQLRTQLSFKLDELVPGCNRYPRVCYRGIVVSPAMWRIPEEFRNSQASADHTSLETLTRWMTNNEVGPYFKYGIHDQTLTFDTREPEDLRIFLKLLKVHGATPIIISEASVASVPVADDQGKMLNAQLILTYYHNDHLFQSVLPQLNPVMNIDEANAFLPGSMWIYYEIFCHPIRSDAIVVNEIAAVVIKAQHLIDKWFFIRYNTPSPHLRLRIKLKSPRGLRTIISLMEQIFKPALKAKKISDLQIRTYYPEQERYGFAGIDLVETMFWRDSEHVLHLLQHPLGRQDLQVQTVQWMDSIFNCLYPDVHQRMLLVKRLAGTFALEFEMSPLDFKSINSEYKTIRALHFPELTRSATQQALFELIENAIAKIGNFSFSEKLLSDLVHLHINRLFPDHQRQQETILYQYLLNHLRMKAARVASPSKW